jgi:hypothetical protein
MLSFTLPTLNLHLLLDSCGPFGIVPDGVCGFFSGAADWFSQSLELIQNPFKWLYHHTLGAPIPQHAGDPGWAACQADWSQPSCPKLIDELQPTRLTLSEAWPRLYASLSVSGVVVAALCCVVRVVRAVFDERSAGVHVVLDAVVRMVVAVGLLIAPTPDNSLLLNVLRLGASASGRIAESAAGAVSSAFTNNLDLGKVVGNIAATGFGLAGIGDFLVAIPILLVAGAFLYVMALYLMRVIQLVFAVATAPLFVAVAVYDHRNRFFQWWVDLATSALVLPVVLAVCGSLTAGIALFFLGGNQDLVSPGGGAEAVTRTLLACFAVLGGVWMTGKAAHGLAWRGFSHGGITGAMTAVSTAVMALPNAAGDVTALVRASGGSVRPGGVLDSLSRSGHRGAALVPPPSRDTGVAVAASAAGHAAALAGESPEVDAAIRGASMADFSRQTAPGLFDGPEMRSAFNQVVGAAVGRFAASDEGRATVRAATAALDASDPSAQARVTEYTRALADGELGGAVAGAAVASLLHNHVPDLAPILGRGTAIHP